MVDLSTVACKVVSFIQVCNQGLAYLLVSSVQGPLRAEKKRNSLMHAHWGFWNQGPQVEAHRPSGPLANWREDRPFTYVYMYVHIFLFIYVYIYVYVCTYIYIYVYVYVYVHIYRIYTYMCMRIYIYVYIHIYICIHTEIRIYIYMYRETFD